MSVLIITGPADKFGHGHGTRMHQVALELKKRKILVQHVTLAPDLQLDVPLPYDIAILDRRDTTFNPKIDPRAKKIAVDNRGTARDEADLAIDLLPHLAMTREEYKHALQDVILAAHVTQQPLKSKDARIKLFDTRAEAENSADFKLADERLSNESFAQKLSRATTCAIYFGQTLFEAIYFGLNIRLYPISEYHKKLGVDLYSRLLIEPELLAAVDGTGLTRFCDKIQLILKEKKK